MGLIALKPQDVVILLKIAAWEKVRDDLIILLTK